MCRVGRQQSPVNINSFHTEIWRDMTVTASFGDMMNLFLDITTDKIEPKFFMLGSLKINGTYENSKKIDYTFSPAGSMSIHAGSEHTIDDKRFDAEIGVNFVGANGKRAVVSFLFDRVDGGNANSEFIESLEL